MYFIKKNSIVLEKYRLGRSATAIVLSHRLYSGRWSSSEVVLVDAMEYSNVSLHPIPMFAELVSLWAFAQSDFTEVCQNVRGVYNGIVGIGPKLV